MPKKKMPVSFDSWLGKVIDDETETHGGRRAIAAWIGVAEQSVNRRARGEVPYLAREVEIIASKVGVPTREIVDRALRGYGGMEKLVAEHGRMSAPSTTVDDELARKRAKKDGKFLGEDFDESQVRRAANVDKEHERDEPSPP